MLFDVCAGRHLSTCFNNLRNIMFTDHELLKLAAKAAGLEPDKAEWTQRAGLVWIQHVDGIRKEFRWNPIDDDGDALRLAVKLRIKFRYNEALGQALAWTGGHPDFESRANIEDCGHDENACARLAIVRAAAEIGRKMKNGEVV